MNKKLLATRQNLLILIIPLVFLAGCAGGKEAVSGNGVVITSFFPDLTEIEGDTTVIFSVNLKNAGGAQASGVKAVLFGLSGDWETTNLNTFKPSGGTTLAAADPDLGLPGEETSIDFSVKAKKDAAKSTDTTYDASVRVFYTYTTTVDTLLRFVTSDYLRTNPNVQKGIVSSESTAGPLLVTAAARTPTISKDKSTARVQFEIQNIGPGKLGVPSSTAGEVANLNKIRKIDIEIKGPTFVTDSCKRTIENQLLPIGGSKVISCDIDVSNIRNFQDVAIKVKLTYDYYLDGFTKVKVLKSLGEVTGAPAAPAVSGGAPPVTGGVGADVTTCQGKTAGGDCTAVSAGGVTITGKCCLKDTAGNTLTALTCITVDSCPA